jgi:hypothetical protein
MSLGLEKHLRAGGCCGFSDGDVPGVRQVKHRTLGGHDLNRFKHRISGETDDNPLVDLRVMF